MADVKSVLGKLLSTKNPTGKMLSGQKKKNTEDITEEILEKD